MSMTNLSPLGLVRKEALTCCYDTILDVTNTIENMQVHYKKFSDPKWQTLVIKLDAVLETLHEIIQTKLD